MKKIIGFVGSPRKNGNTHRLVSKILEGARSRGADTKIINVVESDISGCNSCYYCRQHKECSINDALKPLYDEIYNCDGVVFGSPIYLFQMTGQAKQLMDRFFPFIGPDFKTRLKPGKKMALVFAQASPQVDEYKSYVDHTAKALDFIGFDVQDPLIAGGTMKPDDVENQEETLKKAFDLGVKMAGN